MDTKRLKENFARVAKYGDDVPLIFYSDLFLRAPQVRDMFPVSMSAQRDRLVSALARIVSSVDELDELVPYLRGLGLDHRKFGTLAEHYEAVGASLLFTLAHFSGPDWTPELAADWQAAYALIARTMIDAASQEAERSPSWWDASVVSYERRSVDVAVLRVAPERRLPYLPGQSVAVQSQDRPRVWRFYSMATAPRHDGLLEFHVRVADGGALSTALVRHARPGTTLRLGPAVGALTLDTTSGRDVLMIAGSTGLAPLKAIIDQISALASPPRVRLFFGARTSDGLYDLPDLEKLVARHEWLTVTAAVSHPELDDPRSSPQAHSSFQAHSSPQARCPIAGGNVIDVACAAGSWTEHDAYVCGSTAMTAAAVQRLASGGMPRDRIRIEDFGWSHR